MKHLYYKRHKANWKKILGEGEKLRLVFSASHSKGAVFRDAREHITPQLTQTINDIFAGLPEFYYGRMDIKFSHLGDLKLGKNIEIIEINGASSEAIHIWDKNASLMDAVKTLLWQYRVLFKLGRHQRSQGYVTPGVKMLLKHWLIERKLSKHYPLTD